MQDLVTPSRTLSKPWITLLVATLLAAFAFVLVAALPYFRGDVEKLARYDGKRTWVLVHITSGMVALLLGPFQLWLGFTRPRSALHRRLGMVYLGAISIRLVVIEHTAASY